MLLCMHVILSCAAHTSYRRFTCLSVSLFLTQYFQSDKYTFFPIIFVVVVVFKSRIHFILSRFLSILWVWCIAYVRLLVHNFLNIILFYVLSAHVIFIVCIVYQRLHRSRSTGTISCTAISFSYAMWECEFIHLFI